MRNPLVKLLVAVLFTTLLPQIVSAQYKPPQRSKWQYELTPYAWFSALNGDVLIKGQTAHVDESFSDLLKNLDFAVQVHFEGMKDHCGYFVDPTYIRLSGGGDVNDVPITADLTQWIVELGGVRDFPLKPRGQEAYQQSVGILFGGRYWSLSNTLNLPGQSISDTAAWVDPFIGVRYQTSISPKWRLAGRFDGGGFGLVSGSTWNVFATVAYETAKNQLLLLGYRALYVKHETGAGADRFEYKMTYSGPGLAYQWRF